VENRGQTTYIESLGIYLPPNETSSESRVAGIRSGIRVPLERFTGIKSTHRVQPDEYSYDLACRAIESSLRRSSFRVEDIGLLIACNISKYDREGFVFSIEPNTATCLRKDLGFKNAVAFDINNACAGMFTGILVADCLLQMTDIQAAMVVSGEFISHLSDTAQREITSFFDPRLACLTLGDSGAAVVLARSNDSAVGFQHIEMLTLGAYSSLCRSSPASGSEAGAVMFTDSSELLRVGSMETARHFLQSLHNHGWCLEKVGHVIPHQVSKRGTDSLVRQINSRLNGVKLPRNRVIDNLTTRGNTATTTHLVALHDHIENKRIRSGDRVVFSLTASGLTVGTALYALDDLPARLGNGLPAGKPAVANGKMPSPSGIRAPESVSVVSVATTRLRRQAPASTEDIALEAAETCLAQAPCRRQDIGMVLFTGVFKSGFLAEPSYASILAGKLFPSPHSGASDPAALAFDLHGGPNGFLTACEILRTMVGRRHLRAGLVIAAEFDDNRLLDGYPALGIAEIASAAVIMGPGSSSVQLGDCQFFTFDEYADSFRADAMGVKPNHVSFQACTNYQASLRACVGRAIRAYLARTGRTLADFDEFYFPQISQEFLDALANDLAIQRERIAAVIVPGKDLYTSSLPCILETSVRAGLGGSGKVCLAVSAGPGIHVGCAVIRG
jgi:3-oxoacyl-[acyl-carrier-protein] synthase III